MSAPDRDKDVALIATGDEIVAARVFEVHTIEQIERVRLKLKRNRFAEVELAVVPHEHEPIAEGSRVEVVEIKGVTALVMPAPSDRTEIPKET